MKSKFLVVVLVLFLSSIFTISGLADLYIINDKEGKNVCITNLDILISKYQALGYELILIPPSNLKLTFLPALKEGEIKGTETLQDTGVQDTGTDIQIVDWTNYVEGNYYYVEGLLRNTGRDEVEYIQITAVAYDKSKKLVTLKRSYANPPDLKPGQEATFKVMIKYSSRIADFELRVSWKD